MDDHNWPDWLQEERARADGVIAELVAALEQSRPGSTQGHAMVALLQVWRQQLGDAACRHTPPAPPASREEAE